MRALTVDVKEDGTRQLRYQPDFPTPTPGRGQVLVQVILAGICGTDHHILDDFKDIADSLVLGHEFVGHIHTFGPDCPTSSSFRIGDRVVAEINCLPFCDAGNNLSYGDKAHHPSRAALGLFGMNGAFADYVVVPYENMHAVPHTVSTRCAVFAEPIAAACQILQQVHIVPSDRVAVLGVGKLGWVIGKVLASAACDVTMLTRNTTDSVPQYIRKFSVTDNTADNLIPVTSLLDVEYSSLENSFEVVVECTGSPKGLATCIHLVKPRGKIVFKSTAGPSHALPVDLTPIVVKEIQLLGSRCGPFKPALQLLEKGWLDIDSLITDVFPIQDGETAMSKSKEKGSLKVLLEFK